MDLEAFGKKLESLRRAAGLSREALLDELNLIHQQVGEGELSIDPQLIWKWETAFMYKGRQWIPQRQHVIYLIEFFVDQLTLEEAQRWALGAGYQLGPADLRTIFPPNLDWPPTQAPQLTHFYVRRRQLEAAILDKLEDSRIQSLVLWGAGGAGKTTLAVWVAEQLATHFPDGVIWVSSQPGDGVGDMQEAIAESLGFGLNEDSPEKRARKLHSRLRKRRCLLILDDLLAGADLVHLRLGSETSRLLFTTRDAKVADILEAPLMPVPGLAQEEGEALLANWAGYEVGGGELVTRLGGLPLALSLAGAQLRVGVTLEELLAVFRQERVDLNVLDMDEAQSGTESLILCFDLSYRQLSPTNRQRFALLGYFVRNSFEEGAMAAVWGVSIEEARPTLKQLVRFALLERVGQDFRLHALLQEYSRQKLLRLSIGDEATGQRYAAWHIRYALYHSGLLDKGIKVGPDLEQSWADIIAGVAWATRHEPELASQAALLAHSERPALVEAVGSALIEAVATYLQGVSDQTEKVYLQELLGELQLLGGNYEAGLADFEQAGLLWQTMEDNLRASQARVRMAGAYLLLQDQAAAAQLVRQAQTLLNQSFPLKAADLPRARRLFYWFNMIYNALVRWKELPEEDVVTLVQTAEQTDVTILKARSLHIYRLWCTTREVPRSAQVRERGEALALEAYALWRACGRRDRADDEISFTKYFLSNEYSRRTAIRFARRRSRTTPRVDRSQIRLIKNEGVRWWLEASEAQRVNWLSWMLPRYLGADNRPAHPAKGTRLPRLQPGDRSYRWVDDILNIGVLGRMGRRITVRNDPPPNHILNGPEWRILSGQRAFPLLGSKAKRLVEHYLKSLEACLS